MMHKPPCCHLNFETINGRGTSPLSVCKIYCVPEDHHIASPTGHLNRVRFLPLFLATMLLAKVTSDFCSAVAPAQLQPASSFALDNGGGMKYGDNLSGAVATQPLQHGGDGEEDSLLPKLIDTTTNDDNYVGNDKSVFLDCETLERGIRGVTGSLDLTREDKKNYTLTT